MKKNIASLILTSALLFSIPAAKAQTAYWTENFESTAIPGNSSTSISTPSGVDLSSTSGTWNMYYVFRGSAGCDGKPLRLMKNSSAGIQGTSFAITPKLKDGISKLTFIETTGGKSKTVGVYKSSDNGKTWELAETVSITPDPCHSYTVEINDKSVNKLKFTNESNSDVNLDVVTVYKF